MSGVIEEKIVVDETLHVEISKYCGNIGQRFCLFLILQFEYSSENISCFNLKENF